MRRFRFLPARPPARLWATVAACALSSATAAGCQEEPSRLCEPIRLVWPYFANLDPTLDTSPADGLQIEIVLRTSLVPGSTGSLTVQGEEGDPVPHPETAIAAEDGTLRFSDVTVPFGRVTLHVSVESECGDAESTRTPYVWDGLGFPMCDIDIGKAPAAVEELTSLGVVRAEHDLDPDSPGAQLDVSVQAGRPDMTVTLFVLDVESGEQTIAEEESGEDLVARFPVTLGQAEQAMRAVCVWEEGDLRPSSLTLRLWVDTEVPDCALVAPAGRVVPADDLDPDRAGVQFEMRGRSRAADVTGQPAWFAVQGSELEGGAVDAAGESSVTATLIDDSPGAAQAMSFRTRDRAGNECQAGVTFE